MAKVSEKNAINAHVSLLYFQLEDLTRYDPEFPHEIQMVFGGSAGLPHFVLLDNLHIYCVDGTTVSYKTGDTDAQLYRQLLGGVMRMTPGLTEVAKRARDLIIDLQQQGMELYQVESTSQRLVGTLVDRQPNTTLELRVVVD